MNKEERLQLENELLMTCSKAQAINKYIDELEENSKLSELWYKLQRENKQLKDNQVRALNKIRDFINNANCEIKEGKYSNDNHELYWKLFREKLTNIQKLIKGINTDEYVNIPKYREEELLNLEDNWDKLKEYFNERIEVCNNRLSSPFCNFEKTTKERLIFSQCLEKLEELEQGSDNNE